MSILVCSMMLIGAGAPRGGYDFHARGDALRALNTADAVRRAVVEYTSAMLDNPGDAHVIASRASALADLGQYRAAIHDADTALIHGGDELSYCYEVGRSKPSIVLLRRGLTLACAAGNRDLIPAIGKLLLFYETRYLYVTDEEILP